MVKRAKDTFSGIKGIIYSRTNFKDLHAKSTNSN